VSAVWTEARAAVVIAGPAQAAWTEAWAVREGIGWETGVSLLVPAPGTAVLLAGLQADRAGAQRAAAAAEVPPAWAEVPAALEAEAVPVEAAEVGDKASHY
jgi:hypothetical protein